MPEFETEASVSRRMSQVKQRNTAPEVAVRKMLFRLGYRFRLHRNDLPGRPDIVLPRHKSVILVHGCFWHQHENCQRAQRPASNVNYWNEKLDRNTVRDRENVAKLNDLGWRVLIVWECELKSRDGVKEKLQAFLSS